jgi:hypothetical protein
VACSTILLLLLTYVLSNHSVGVGLTLVETKQLRINIHKPNNTKTVQTTQNTVNTVHILPKDPHIFQNIHTYTQPHITKVNTTTVQDTHEMK